jgi:hypothetical protein
MTQEQKLRSKLRKAIKDLKVTPNQIKERKAPLNKKGAFENPFPIGTRSIYVFAKGGDISDSHKWKLFIHFNQN